MNSFKSVLLCLCTVFACVAQEEQVDKAFRVKVYNYTGQKVTVYPLKENFVGTLYVDTDKKVTLSQHGKTSFSTSRLKKLYIVDEYEYYVFKVPISLKKFTAEKMIISHIEYDVEDGERPLLAIHMKSSWGEKRTIYVRASRKKRRYN